MIRDVQPEEVARFAGLGADFFAEGRLPGVYSPSRFVESWDGLLRMPTNDELRAIFLGMWDDCGGLPVGGIGGVVVRDNLTEDRLAMEQFWYVAPAHRGNGGRLLREFERRVSELGAKRVLMMHLETVQPEVMARFYRRNGYNILERTYWKEL